MLDLTGSAFQTLKFERDDWALFRTIEGLQQKAGVPKDKLRRLVLKELTDYAFDEFESMLKELGIGGLVDEPDPVRVGKLDKVGNVEVYFIEDRGRGIDGSPDEIARLYSIARPLVTTKLLRLPTRGALGNGLRVVAGAVLASNGGSLIVITKNQRIEPLFAPA
jgi:hypothetical protein